jgi:ketosteroid isomerase-like protein
MNSRREVSVQNRLTVSYGRKANTTSQAQAEQEVMHLVNEWADAEGHGDTKVLKRLLADDYIGIGPLGFMLTKLEWIARHETGQLRYTAFGLDEVRVRVYNNDSAIVTGHQAQQATYSGNDIPGQFRISLVFVQQAGQWQLVSLQLSSIGQPPKFAQS